VGGGGWRVSDRGREEKEKVLAPFMEGGEKGERLCWLGGKRKKVSWRILVGKKHSRLSLNGGKKESGGRGHRKGNKKSAWLQYG